MRLCVVDCSFTMAWVFQDEQHPAATELLARLENDGTIVVPSGLWALEVRNTLRSAVRRKRLTTAAADAKRRLLLAVPRIAVTCPNALGDDVDRLMRSHDLTSYDATYLAVAIEHELPLATGDQALAKAARDAGVQLFAN